MRPYQPKPGRNAQPEMRRWGIGLNLKNQLERVKSVRAEPVEA